MKHGAVAIFDALGFKGIWSRVLDPDTVIAKLRAFQEVVDEELGDVHSRVAALGKELGIDTEISVALLSDTVVIGAAGKIVDHLDRREQDDCDWLAVLALARITGKLLVRAAQAPPALHTVAASPSAASTSPGTSSSAPPWTKPWRRWTAPTPRWSG